MYMHLYNCMFSWVRLRNWKGVSFSQFSIPFYSILPMSLSSAPWILNLKNHLVEVVNSGFICDIYIRSRVCAAHKIVHMSCRVAKIGLVSIFNLFWNSKLSWLYYLIREQIIIYYFGPSWIFQSCASLPGVINYLSHRTLVGKYHHQTVNSNSFRVRFTQLNNQLSC